MVPGLMQFPFAAPGPKCVQVGSKSMHVKLTLSSAKHVEPEFFYEQLRV